MLKSVSGKLTTSLAKALCLPGSQTGIQTRTLSSSHTMMEKEKLPPSTSSTSSSPSTATSSTQSPDLDPTPPSTDSESPNQTQTPNSSTYTPTDAANFSRLGASMTAMPADEAESLSLSPVTTLRCERLGAVVRSGTGSAGGKEIERVKELYTTAHAAEFMRRGACMVVWPDEEEEGVLEREERKS
ncbi:hypothetical protein IFR05_000080 [Cadophora sp. M221]|nr:hypothetical protein IFR05_000080 [Cadophora sp. M221]